MELNSSINTTGESKASLQFVELTPEESATISGGFFKKLSRGLKKAVKGIGNGISNFVLDEMLSIAKNPWGWATGSQQRDVYDLDGWNRQ